MMRLFSHKEITKAKCVVYQNYQTVSKNDCESITEMYQQSLYESYYQLWRSEPLSFSSDILQHGKTVESSIMLYSEKIAKLTLKEWEEFNLSSVIAYENKKIVGFALYGKDDETKMNDKVCSYYLYYIGTAPSNFQKGLGTEIMLSMLKNCQKQAVKNEDNLIEMKLHTRVFNVPAIRLYEKFGFYILPNDITHGHSNKYLCYFNQFDPTLEIKPLKKDTLSNGYEPIHVMQRYK